jgi:predicted alpha/beta-hydrolase family hydrolase
MYEEVSNFTVDPPVQGFLHRPLSPSGDGLILTHGAGGNAQMALLVALAEAFAGAGFMGRGDAVRDREGLKNAVAAMRKLASGRVFLGGQSYGGRQASMLLADEPVADGLLLLSYPLHPPGKPEQLRTEHLPRLRVSTLFVEGTRDPFGTMEEIEAARKLIPAKTELLTVEGAGHDLGFRGKTKSAELPGRVLGTFQQLFG